VDEEPDTRYVLTRPIIPVNDSHMSLAEIQIEVQKLEPAERAALIDVLWDSLDEEKLKEGEAKWAAESEDRIDAFERGELPAADGPSALEQLRSSLTK
jgi:putative addiction module component (TIGR02574 family)